MALLMRIDNGWHLRCAFKEYGRADQFSNGAYDVLFDWFDGIGEDVELDVIAICCDWCEYDDLAEIIDDYDVEVISLRDSDVDEAEYEQMIVDSMNDMGHAMLECGGGRWVVSS